MIHSHKYSDKWTKIGVDIEICLGNKQGNFQIHTFTRRENITKSFRGLLFWLTLYIGCQSSTTALVFTHSHMLRRQEHRCSQSGSMEWSNAWTHWHQFVALSF